MWNRNTSSAHIQPGDHGKSCLKSLNLAQISELGSNSYAKPCTSFNEPCSCFCDRYLDENTKYHINPCGNFVIGGPMGDAGLTGRKIIVDTYGGWGAHGGGAFSGKDYTKVDRSAAYAARWVAKSLVKAGLARRCLVQVAYAIGVAEPLSITVMDYGTSKKSCRELTEIVRKNFDLRPGRIVKDLKLKTPIFQQTSSYGHFGRSIFTWEQPKELQF